MRLDSIQIKRHWGGGIVRTGGVYGKIFWIQWWNKSIYGLERVQKTERDKFWFSHHRIQSNKRAGETTFKRCQQYNIQIDDWQLHSDQWINASWAVWTRVRDRLEND